MVDFKDFDLDLQANRVRDFSTVEISALPCAATGKITEKITREWLTYDACSENCTGKCSAAGCDQKNQSMSGCRGC